MFLPPPVPKTHLKELPLVIPRRGGLGPQGKCLSPAGIESAVGGHPSAHALSGTVPASTPFPPDRNSTICAKAPFCGPDASPILASSCRMALTSPPPSGFAIFKECNTG